MHASKFTKRVENFTCERCGASVTGTGYTNHCPKCLWSKHVDVYPGDRAATCGGMMEPIRLEGTVKKYRIVHRCTVCDYSRRNTVVKEDDIGKVISLAGKPVS